MRSAVRKAMVGVAVAIGLLVALLVPGLMGERQPTELATQNSAVAEGPAQAPSPAPTEITLPSATAVPPTATPIPPTPVPPTATATVVPTAVVIAAPTAVPVQPTTQPEPTVTVASAQALPAAPAPVQPTVASTLQPTATPTIEPTPEPTAEPTVEPTAEPTPEPTVEPTVEPTPEPTVEPTVEPTPEPTAEPTVDPGPTLEVASTWMYVTSTDGLFLRDVPGGQIVNVLTYRSQVHLTGQVESNGERLWAQVDLPDPGWVAIAFLSSDEPEPPASTGPTRPTEPPTSAEWAAFRDCESGGRYDVVDPSGLYHGAYQFLPSTWDGLARRFWPELAGVLPSAASPADQDKMALKLFELEGTRPWPTCGRHLL